MMKIFEQQCFSELNFDRWKMIVGAWGPPGTPRNGPNKYLFLNQIFPYGGLGVPY